LAPLLEARGELPADIIQGLFAGLDPLLVPRKFLAFARLDPDSPKAAAFVALEDWLNDGVALTAPVARECLGGWYGDNAPARGAWRIAGRIVDPRRLDLPSLCMIPARDRIVPPASAQALADLLPGTETLVPRLGHIGMMVSAGAEAQVWRPLADWLTARAENSGS
jgi:polyhydroxyalkanoate synthase